MKTVSLAILKIALTLGLFALVFRSIDVTDVVMHFKRVSAATLLTVGVLFIGQYFVSCVRLIAIASALLQQIALPKALRINAIGAFFGQALVTFVSGDVVRAMMLSRACKIPMRSSVRTVALDRLVGLLSSMLIVSLTAPWAIQLAGDGPMRHSIVLLAVAGLMVIVGFAAVGYLARHPAVAQIAQDKLKQYRIVYAVLDTLAVARHLYSGWRQLPLIVASSLLIQLLNVAAIFLLINGMGAHVTIWECLLIVPTVMLISLLPFSIAGWGLRESAMATGFALIQAPAAAALAASVMFGLFTLLLALPGGILWWSSSKADVPLEKLST